MSTDQQSAATATSPTPAKPAPDAPVIAETAPARTGKGASEIPATKKSLYLRARHAVRSAVCTATVPVLDAGIRLLQSLRTWFGSAPVAKKNAGEDQPGAKRDRPDKRRDDAPLAKVEAPVARHRLRALLIYCSLLLVGGVGGAFAHQLLNKQFNERIEGGASTPIKPITTAPDTLNETKAEDTQSESVAAAEQKPDSSSPDVTDMEKQLEAAQAARIDAEKKLAAFRAEQAKSAAAQQMKLDAAEKRLAMMARSGKPVPIKTGNCNLSSGNANALKGCIENFNR